MRKLFPPTYLLVFVLAFCARHTHAVGPFSLSVEQYRGDGDTLFLEFYIQSNSANPVDWFALGNSNLVVYTSTGVDLANVGIRALSADSGVFNTPAYQTVQVSGQPVFGFINLTILQNLSGGPGTLITNSQKYLAARVYTLITGCAFTSTLSWNVTGSLREYGTFLNLQPIAVRVPPTPLFLGADIINGPSQVCYSSQSMGFGSVTPGNWILLTSTSSFSVITSPVNDTDSVTVNFLNTSTSSVFDTLIHIVGNCRDTLLIEVQPNPAITGPTPVCAGDLGATYTVVSTSGSYSLVSTIGTTSTQVLPVATLNFGNTLFQVFDTLFFQDAIGCADTFVVTVNPNPSPAISGPTSVSYFGNDSLYTVTAFDANNSYSWNVSANATIDYTSTNGDSVLVDFTVSGQDSIFLVEINPLTGCFGRDTLLVDVICPQGTITGPDTVCEFSGPYTYTNSFPVVNWIVSGSSISIIASTPLSTTLLFGDAVNPFVRDTLFAFFLGGCTDTLLIDVFDNSTPNVIIGSDTAEFLAQDSLYFILPLPNHSYSWEVIGQAQLDFVFPSGDSIYVDFLFVGEAFVILHDTNLITGCFRSDTLRVGVGGCAVGQVLGDTIVCSQELGKSYFHPEPSSVWSISSAIGSAIVFGGLGNVAIIDFGSTATPVIDTLFVMYAGACSDTVLISVSPPPTVLLPSIDTTVCQYDTLQLLSDYPGIWWRIENGLLSQLSFDTNSITVVYNTPLTNLDTIFVQVGACSSMRRVQVDTVPSVNIIGPTSVYIPLPPVSYTSAFTPTYAYLWSLLTSSSAITSSANTADLTFTSVGIDTLSLLVTDLNTGCTRTSDIEIQINNCTASVGVLSNDTTVCSGSLAIPYIYNNVGLIIQWQDSTTTSGTWTNEGGPFQNSQVLIHFPVDTTYFRVIVSNGLCSDTSAVTVVNVSQPAIAGTASVIGSDTVCVNQVVQLQTVGYQADSIEWQSSVNGISFWMPLALSNTPIYSITPPLGTTYYRVRSFTGCGTAVSNVIKVTVNDSAIGSFASALDSICLSTPTGPLGANLITGQGFWSTTGSGGFNSPTNPGSEYIPHPSDAGLTIDLSWNVVSQGCPPVVSTHSLYIAPIPQGSFTTPLLPLCVGDTSQNLAASVQVGTGYWSTTIGSITGFIDPSNPNTSYASTLADAGLNIDLMWIVSTGTICPNDTNSGTLFVGTPPNASFSSPIPPICAGNPTDTLRATNLIGFGSWTTNGGGFFNVINDTTAIYFSVLSDADTNVAITYIASSGGCPMVASSQPLQVDSSSLGLWSAIIDSLCAGVNTQPLNAAAIRGVGMWATSGFGYFYPNAVDPNARYYTDTLESNSDVTLYWIVTNGACAPDTQSTTFHVKGTKVYGQFNTIVPDICLTDSTIPLNASVLYGNGAWVVMQGGSYLASSDPNTRYIPDQSVSGDTVTLYWRISVPGCTSLDLFKDIFVYSPPQGLFGPNTLSPICIGDSTSLLFSQVIIGTNSYWTTTGLGSLYTATGSPNYYIPSVSDAGTTLDICFNIENGVCPTLNLCKPLLVSQQPGATFPGPLNNACAGTLSDTLFATVINGTGQWSCIGCSGTFSNITDPNAVYNSVLADAGNTIQIIWTTSSPGCPDSVLTQNLTIDPILVSGSWVDLPQPVCYTDTTPPLNASISVGVYSWSSSGNGIFINTFDPGLTQYVPDITDAGDTIIITYTISDGGGLCNSLPISYPLVVDTFGVGSISGFLIDTICYGDTSVAFAGTTIYGNSFWQSAGGPGGQFMPNSSSSIVQFVPSPLDAGFDVPLLWISSTSACPNDTDSVVVRVDPIPFGSFVQNLNPICAGGMTNPLNGVAFAGVGHWETTGLGSFVPNANMPNPRYQSVIAEAGDTIQLRWVIESGVCPPAIYIRNLIIRNNITDGNWPGLSTDIICCNDSTSPLSATVLTGIGFWSSSIPGAFFPSVNDPNAQFVPSNLACDNSVVITWNIQDSSGLCQVLSYSDTLTVNKPGYGFIVSPSPLQVCVGDTTDFFTGIALSGIGSWQCINCSGHFTDSLSQATQYVTSSIDVNNDPLVFNWNVSTLGCLPTTYTTLLSVNDSSQGIFPGFIPDTICAGSFTPVFNASAVFGSGVWSCTNCDGAFQNPFSGNARYISTVNDGGNSVNLHWIVTNGVCPPDTSTQVLFVNEFPSGGIGLPPPIFCEGTLSGPISGVLNSGTGFWTVQGGSGFLTQPDSLITHYQSAIGDADTTVLLVWNITNQPGCDTIRYTRVLNLQRQPSVIGDTSSMLLCIESFSSPLGLTPISGQGVWYTSGNGYFLDNTDGNTRYFASSLDAGDTITLTYRVGNQYCDSLDFTRRVIHIGGGSFAATILTPTADTTVCILTNIPLIATTGGFNTWQVSTGLLSSSSGDSVSISYSSAVVSSSIILTTTDTSTGCITRDTLFITANSGLPIDVAVGGSVVTSTQICQGDSIQAVLNNGVSNWSWAIASGAINHTVPNPILKDTTTTIYTVTALTANGCPSTTVFVLNVIPFQQIEIIGDDFCEGDTTFFQVLNGNVCTTLSWFNAALSTVINEPGGITNPNNQYLVQSLNGQTTIDLTQLSDNTYTYSLSCFNSQTGCRANRELTFRVVPYPYANFVADQRLLPYDNGTLTPRTVNFTDLSQNATFWFWFFDDVNSMDSTSNAQNPTHQFTGPGLYTIALFVQNELGCGDIDIKSDYIEVLEQEFYFPTAFSPNGDNLNDRFRALPAGSARMSVMEIYDRWGVKVYSTSDINGWDGNTDDGRPFDPGTYLYRALIELDTRGVVEYKGYVTLIR